MNKSKGVVGIIILLTGVMLFGCGDKNNKSSEEAKSEIFSTKEQGVAETKITYPEEYMEEVDGTLSFQAKVVPPNNLHKKNAEMMVTYKTIDFEIALKELFSDVDEPKRKEEIIQPENSLFQSAYNEKDEWISNRQGFLYMEKAHWKKIRNAVELSSKDLAYNAEKYQHPQTFEFGTADEAWKNLQETVKKLGVEMELKPFIFYLDYETMEKEAAKNPENVTDDWNDSDNGYYISAVQCYDENTIFANSYYGKGIEGEADTANILAYIDKNGIQKLELTRIVDQIKETGKYWELLPFENIIEAVKQRFALTITGDKVKIKEIRFSYMTEAIGDEKYRLIPVWFCNYEKTGKDGSATIQQFIINASTGEDVIYELY